MRLPTIDRRALDAVTGGRITHVDQLPKAAIDALNGLTQAVEGLKQVFAKRDADSQGMQQQAFQMLQEKQQGGDEGGGHSGRRKRG